MFLTYLSISATVWESLFQDGHLKSKYKYKMCKLTTVRMLSVISFSCCTILNLKEFTKHKLTTNLLPFKLSTFLLISLYFMCSWVWLLSYIIFNLSILSLLWLQEGRSRIYMFIWWGPGLVCFSGKLLSTMVLMALWKTQEELDNTFLKFFLFKWFPAFIFVHSLELQWIKSTLKL